MATYYKEGSAHQDENGNISGGKAGDQTGREVSYGDFDPSRKASGWYVLRAKDTNLARLLATRMVAACDNNNIGYNQAKRYSIISDGIDSAKPTSCDCSTLVRQCIIEATASLGSKVDPGDFTTTNEPKVLESTGLFYDKFAWNLSVELITGDILVTRTKGHTLIIVEGVSLGEGTNVPVNPSASDSGTYSTLTTVEGFKPRFEAPDPVAGSFRAPGKGKPAIPSGFNDRYYVSIDEGGYNPFGKVYKTNRAYAWCRFNEAGNMETHGLPRGNPSTWYGHSEDGYERNVAATLGAVMCFYKEGTDGYAAIVEEVTADSITTSEYTIKGEFKITKRTKRYGSWDFDGYTFQGFIHNPCVDMEGIAVSAMDSFLKVAESHVGEGASWTAKSTGVTLNNGWSAAYIVACARSAGSSLNIVIPNTTSCSAIGRIGVLRDMGKWLSGPAQGQHNYGQPGDIVLFRKCNNSRRLSIYMADHAGIVIRASSEYIEVAEGDYGGKVALNRYKVTSGIISGYFRPNWESIDGTTDSVKDYRSVEGLYTNGVSIEDACAREVCYLDSSIQPSIAKSHIKLSPINYTGLLASMYSVFAQSSDSNDVDADLIVDLWTSTVESTFQGGKYFASTLKVPNIVTVGGSTSSGITSSSSMPSNTSGNLKAAFDYLISKGFNAAAVVGVLANIRAESNFNTSAVGDHGTSFGICQWHNNRGENMKKFVGSDWSTNLTKQIDYLIFELQNSYKKVLSTMMNCPNTLTGAKQVADVFVRKFEIPSNVDSESQKRQQHAAEIWASLV